ncbi:hypothetical protein NL676_025391 [Syzygium grande]|nr:hypothetical protein NL676_025391 [Syzygium grande]
MVISVPDAYQCYKWDNQTRYERNVFLDLSSFPPYRFSDTRNKLTVLGRDTYALMSDQDGTFGSGCISYCSQNVHFANETACSGLGCCQTSIPKGLKTLNIRLKSFEQYESVRQFNPCGLGFVVDSNSFNISERKLPSYEDINNTTELALDWMVEWDVTCEKARSNQLDYACRDNTDCKDFANGSGYRCVCKPGYSGNPYNLTHGCQVSDSPLRAPGRRRSNMGFMYIAKSPSLEFCMRDPFRAHAPSTGLVLSSRQCRSPLMAKHHALLSSELT